MGIEQNHQNIVNTDFRLPSPVPGQSKGGDLEGIIRCLQEYLATQPDVVAAYVFGSWAQGRPRPESDVDVAVLLKEDLDAEARLMRRLELGNALEELLNRKVDLVVLNDAPPLLQHQVLLHGKRVFERDRMARVEFEVRAGKVYADLKPMFDFFTEAMLREIEEGRFGGRR